MYELFYGSGGHGGPYLTLDDAIRAAYRLLYGRYLEQYIDVKQYQPAGSKEVYSLVLRVNK